MKEHEVVINDLQTVSRTLEDQSLQTLQDLVDEAIIYLKQNRPLRIAETIKGLIDKWDKEEDKIDEQIKFLREHKFELEQIATYHKRNEMTSRRLELQQIFDSNFSA